MIVLGGHSAWAAPSDEDQNVFDNLDRDALDSHVRGLGVDADPLEYVVQSTRSQVVAGRNWQEAWVLWFVIPLLMRAWRLAGRRGSAL